MREVIGRLKEDILESLVVEKIILWNVEGA